MFICSYLVDNQNLRYFAVPKEKLCDELLPYLEKDTLQNVIRFNDDEYMKFIKTPVPCVSETIELDWEFVTRWYPDYWHSQRITLANDVSCVIDFGDVSKDDLVSEEMYESLSAQLADEPNGDLSEGHISWLPDFIGTNLTLEEVETMLDVECKAIALHRYSLDNDLENEAIKSWLSYAKACLEAQNIYYEEIYEF